MKRVSAVVVCAQRWGGAGNLIWAKNLSRALRNTGVYEVELLAADSEKSYLGEKADELDILKKRASGKESLRNAYNGWANRIYSELSELWTNSTLGNLASRAVMTTCEELPLKSTSAVFCTKGIIAQLVGYASKTLASKPIVLNFVTNPGLLTFKMHRPTLADIHVVPHEGWACSLLRCGFELNKIRQYHVAETEIINFSWPSKLSKLDPISPTLVAIANHDGADWIALLHRWLDLLDRAQIIFISVGDPDLEAEVSELLTKRCNSNWISITWITPNELASALSELNRTGTGVVITKPGPSIINLLSRYELVPTVVLDAGLPVEDWLVGNLIMSGCHVATDPCVAAETAASLCSSGIQNLGLGTALQKTGLTSESQILSLCTNEIIKN